MTALNHFFYAFLLLFLCTMPIESSRHRDRERKKQHREPASLPSQQHHIIESKVMPINLCSKGRDMKLVCHCSPDNENARAHKAECWIFRPDLTVFDPDWTAFHTQTQLTSLGFLAHGSGNLSFIPTTVIQSLKHLEKLSIEYAEIHEIFSYAFGNFTRIKNITLSSNQIKSINSYAFANLIELTELTLANNEIFEIDPFAFMTLPSLNRLNLATNRIQTLHEDTFESLESLGELFLSHNNIDSVQRETFKGLGNLWNLRLDHNKLRRVEEEAFAEMPNLVELDLGYNEIEVICCNDLTN